MFFSVDPLSFSALSRHSVNILFPLYRKSFTANIHAMHQRGTFTGVQTSRNSYVETCGHSESLQSTEGKL